MTAASTPKTGFPGDDLTKLNQGSEDNERNRKEKEREYWENHGRAFAEYYRKEHNVLPWARIDQPGEDYDNAAAGFAGLYSSDDPIKGPLQPGVYRQQIPNASAINGPNNPYGTMSPYDIYLDKNGVTTPLFGERGVFKEWKDHFDHGYLLDGYKQTMDFLAVNKGATSIHIDWDRNPHTNKVVINKSFLEDLMKEAQKKGLGVHFGPHVEEFLRSRSQATRTKFYMLRNQINAENAKLLKDKEVEFAAKNEGRKTEKATNALSQPKARELSGDDELSRKNNLKEAITKDEKGMDLPAEKKIDAVNDQLNYVDQRLRNVLATKNELQEQITNHQKAIGDDPDKAEQALGGTANQRRRVNLVDALHKETDDLKLRAEVLRETVDELKKNAGPDSGKNYELKLMSELKGNKDSAEKNKIYISADEGGSYVVRDAAGTIKEGKLENIDLKNLETRINDETLKAQVLEATTKAGHTLPPSKLELCDTKLQSIENNLFNLIDHEAKEAARPEKHRKLEEENKNLAKEIGKLDEGIKKLTEEIKSDEEKSSQLTEELKTNKDEINAATKNLENGSLELLEQEEKLEDITKKNDDFKESVVSKTSEAKNIITELEKLNESQAQLVNKEDKLKIELASFPEKEAKLAELKKYSTDVSIEIVQLEAEFSQLRDQLNELESEAGKPEEGQKQPGDIPLVDMAASPEGKSSLQGKIAAKQKEIEARKNDPKYAENNYLEALENQLKNRKGEVESELVSTKTDITTNKNQINEKRSKLEEIKETLLIDKANLLGLDAQTKNQKQVITKIKTQNEGYQKSIDNLNVKGKEIAAEKKELTEKIPMKTQALSEQKTIKEEKEKKQKENKESLQTYNKPSQDHIKFDKMSPQEKAQQKENHLGKLREDVKALPDQLSKAKEEAKKNQQNPNPGSSLSP